MLDVAISKRPSRFDRKYHFPLPANNERARYCELWRYVFVFRVLNAERLLSERTKLAKNASLDFPAELTIKIASKTEGLSFAYLQEVFVSSMTAILTDQSSQSVQPKDKALNDAVNADTIWQVVSKQIDKIRKEMQDSRKSIIDAGKNTVSVNAVSSSIRPTGFGR